MALINCKECNLEISDKTVKCPHCGAPTNRLDFATVVQGLGGIIILYMGYMLFSKNWDLVKSWFLP